MLRLSVAGVIAAGFAGCISVVPCDHMPCAVSYTALRAEHRPPRVQSVTLDQFRQVPREAVAVVILARGNTTQASSVQGDQIAELKARGYRPMGNLAIPSAMTFQCVEDDFLLLRWKAYALGFDGVAITDREMPCTAIALLRDEAGGKSR